MNDIFLSYASEDREVARKLVNVFTSIGWSVFWDRETPVGKSWDRVVEEQLTNARVITPLWSPRSVESDWVMIEATEGMEQKKLFPALIQSTRIPLRFKLTQFADLSDWDGSMTHDGCARLLTAIAAHLGRGLPALSQQREATARMERRTKSHDVFLGYARVDEKSAQSIVTALSAANISVWWDRAIVVGESFDNTILKALEQARAVLIVWSRHGVASPWVQAEARWAIDRGILINVAIDETPLPPGFSAAPSVDLTQWDHGAQTLAIQNLLSHLADVIPPEAGNQEPLTLRGDDRRRPRRREVLLILLIAIVVAAVLIGVYIGKVLAAGG